MATNPQGDPDDHRTDDALAVLADSLFAPPRSTDGGHCYEIPEGPCSSCGDRASRSVYSLQSRRRTLLCGVCRA